MKLIKIYEDSVDDLKSKNNYYLILIRAAIYKIQTINLMIQQESLKN